MINNMFYFYLEEEVLLYFIMWWLIFDTSLNIWGNSSSILGRDLGMICFGCLIISFVCGWNMGWYDWDRTYFDSWVGIYLNLVIVCFFFGMNFLEENDSFNWGFLNLCIMLGGFLILSFASWLCCWAVLELLGVCFYILLCIGSSSISSTEAALNYLIFNNLGSGFIFVGCVIFWLNSSCGSYNYVEVGLDFCNVDGLLIVGLVSFLCGLFINLGIFPFNLWLADCYEAASLGGLGTLTVVSNIVTLMFFWKVFFVLINIEEIRSIIVIFSVISMWVFVFLGVSQISLGSVWAYSSMVNLCYLLLSCNTASHLGFLCLLIYLGIYMIVSLGFFLIWFLLISHLRNSQAVTMLDLVNFNHIAFREGSFFWLSFLSVAGLPPLMGFFSNFLLISSLLAIGDWLLAILCILAGVFALSFYLNVFNGLVFGSFWGWGLYISGSSSLYCMLAFFFMANYIFYSNLWCFIFINNSYTYINN